MTRPPVTGWVSVRGHGSAVRITASGTSTGVLVAKAWGIVREVRPLLDALKRQGFFISDELYQHVLHMGGEL
jgi:predicted nucleic acid-binding protein